MTFSVVSDEGQGETRFAFGPLVVLPSLLGSATLHAVSMDDFAAGMDSSLDLALVLSSLESTGREQLSDELLSLSAIYDNEDGTAALSIYQPTSPAIATSSTAPLRLVLSTSLPSSAHPFSLLLTIPPTYPATESPLIQLQSLYLSSFAVSDDLFGQVLRTFMHDPAAAAEGVQWTAGDVCLYEGVECVRTICQAWVDEREKEGEKGEEERRAATSKPPGVYDILVPEREEGQDWEEEDYEKVDVREVPAWKKKGANGQAEGELRCPTIISSEPLLDRKSVSVKVPNLLLSLTL